jgi:hypothetical protein
MRKNRTAPRSAQKRVGFPLAAALSEESWDRLLAARCLAKRRLSRWIGHGRQRRQRA